MTCGFCGIPLHSGPCDTNMTREYIMNLLAVIDLYDKAAVRFMKKVDSGKARSVETYREGNIHGPHYCS